MRIEITDKMIADAARKSVSIGTLKNSFSNGNRQIVGILGQEMFKVRYPDAVEPFKYDYDFVLRGQKVEVKTRIFSIEPNDSWDFVIPQTMNQQFDYIFFCGIHSSLSFGHIYGFLSKAQYEASKVISAGDPMPQGGYYKAGGKIVFVRDLQKVKENKLC